MKRVLIYAALVLTEFCSAQDLHFSQILQSPTLLNPGAVGVYDGWERAIIHHRNQWLGGNTSFSSTSLSADMTFLKNPQQNRAYIGTGLSFYNDVGGDARFGTQVAALTFSGVLPVGKKSLISLGLQGGFGSRRGDISKLVFDSQWAGSMYDPLIASGENGGLRTFRYADVSTGIFYQFGGGQNNFARDNKTKFQIGFSVYHVNQPKMRYTTGSTESLYRKYVGMVNYSREIPNSLWMFEIQAAQFVQGPHSETIFGTVIRKRFHEATKITGLSHDASIGFGAWMRLNDAIIPTVQLDYSDFRFALSYDYTVTKLRSGYSGGSVELSLTWINRHDALFRKRYK